LAHFRASIISTPGRIRIGIAARLSASGASVEFRMPLVLGYNDDEEDLERMTNFIKDVTCKEPCSRGSRPKPTLHILPYHQLGISKYEQLGEYYPLMGVPTPSAELMEAINSML
jgi:pyruvate formate lyase activating enzyme